MILDLEGREETMRVLTKEGAARFLGVDALDAFLSQRAGRLKLAGTAYPIPSDTRAKTALAKFLGYLLLKQPEVCLYLTGWSLRSSPEHLDLFYGYRLSAGAPARLAEAPVHVFEPAGSEALVS